MKALSIRQPWAWLIVNGYKGVENRSWNTKHRGEFLVHAGKGMTMTEYKEVFHFAMAQKIDIPPHNLLERGGIIGKASLINTVHISEKHLLAEKDQPWFFGEYGFILDSQETLPFKPCKGQLGFFTPKFD